MISNLKHAVVPASLFFVLSLPQLYGKTGSYFGENSGNCPSMKTRLLHALAFFALTYLITKYTDTEADKSHLVRYSLNSSLAFLVLSSPELYHLTESLFRRVNTDFAGRMGPNNCPSMTGIAVHSVLFAVFLSWAKSL